MGKLSTSLVDTTRKRGILHCAERAKFAVSLAATGASTLAAVVLVMTMKTHVIRAGSLEGKRQAVELLKSGALVAFPTDTVYGLAAYPWDEAAVEDLYRIKKRPEHLPIPLLLSDRAELDRVAVLPERCEELPARFWPGGLTLVLPKTAAVVEAISGRPTVAVRVPDHPLTRELLGEVGGVLAVTSANISGKPSPITARQVEAQLGGRVPLILDGGACPVGVASTVLDCSVSPPLLLRRGAVSEAALRAVIGALHVA